MTDPTTPCQSLRFERRLSHPPRKVWRAITEPEHLSRWYPLRINELPLEVGGPIRFDDGEGTTYDGKVVEVDPPRVFAFTEEDDLVRIELRAEGEGSVLVFTHTFDAANAAQGAEDGWKGCLDQLERLVGELS